MTFKATIADLTTRAISTLVRIPGPTFARHVALGLGDRYSAVAHHEVELLLPALAAPDRSDRAIVERIYKAYLAAKRDYATADLVFRPSSLWEDFIEASFGQFDFESLDGFHQFLSNFGCCEAFTGFEYGNLIHRCKRDQAMDNLLRHCAVPRMISLWRMEQGDDCPIDSIQLPMHGNMAGVLIDGHPFPLNGFFDLQCADMVTQCMEGNQFAVGELGSGYGGMAYFLLSQKCVSSYVSYDLPEVSACCAYYLMKAFPEKEFCLYGEHPNPTDELDRFDAVLLPGFCLSDAKENQFGVFINRCSLSEMRPETAKAFLEEIWSSSQYFWHLNHERSRNVFADGQSSLLNSDYDPPANKALLARFREHTCIPYLLETDEFDYFWCLYGPSAPMKTD